MGGIPVIGLIGGIGAGKSVVAAALQSLGCVIADADANVKTVLQTDSVRGELVAWWGEEILGDDGKIDRSKVAKIVFEASDERKRLEALIHPLVRRMQEKQFSSAPNGTIALVIDAPLLLESGLETLCDVVLFVEAPLNIRLRRVQKTRGWDAKELDRRELTQIPLDIKRKKADYVIINAGELGLVHTQIESILAEIQARQFKAS